MIILNFDYTNIVYISHPFAGHRANYDEVTKTVTDLQMQHPDWLILSPIHTFSMLYDKLEYQDGLDRCLWLLEKCDEMLVYGDYKNSKGCLCEIEYCKLRNIPYKIMG